MVSFVYETNLDDEVINFIKSIDFTGFLFESPLKTLPHQMKAQRQSSPLPFFYLYSNTILKIYSLKTSPKKIV